MNMKKKHRGWNVIFTSVKVRLKLIQRHLQQTSCFFTVILFFAIAHFRLTWEIISSIFFYYEECPSCFIHCACFLRALFQSHLRTFCRIWFFFWPPPPSHFWFIFNLQENPIIIKKLLMHSNWWCKLYLLPRSGTMTSQSKLLLFLTKMWKWVEHGRGESMSSGHCPSAHTPRMLKAWQSVTGQVEKVFFTKKSENGGWIKQFSSSKSVPAHRKI